MNEKKCSSIMERYLALDRGERVPMKASAHFMVCKKCRDAVKALKRAERVCAAPLSVKTPVTDSAIAAVLARVSPALAARKRKNPISVPAWISVGVVMMLLTMTFIFSTKGLSRRLDASLGLVYAAEVLMYCTVFVASNMDFFVKRISTRCK